MIKCSSACSCFNNQLKVVLPHFKIFLTENLELNQFALESYLKGKGAELNAGKQDTKAVRLSRKWKAYLFLCNALCLTGCLHLAKYLCKADNGIHSEVHSFDMKHLEFSILYKITKDWTWQMHNEIFLSSHQHLSVMNWSSHVYMYKIKVVLAVANLVLALTEP